MRRNSLGAVVNILALGTSKSLGIISSPVRREYLRPEAVWMNESNLIE